MMNEENVAKTLVGLVITFIFLSIINTNPSPYSTLGQLGVSSGVGVAFSLIFWSIVCTLGISLVIWIPIWYVVGLVVFEIVGLMSKALKGKPTTKDATSLPRDKQATISYIKKRETQTPVNYIKKARSKGVSDDQISLDLQASGWVVEDEINWAFDALK